MRYPRLLKGTMACSDYLDCNILIRQHILFIDIRSSEGWERMILQILLLTNYYDDFSILNLTLLPLFLFRKLFFWVFMGKSLFFQLFPTFLIIALNLLLINLSLLETLSSIAKILSLPLNSLLDYFVLLGTI